MSDVLIYVLPAEALDKNNLNLDCYLKEHYPFSENTIFDVKKYQKYYLVFVYEKNETALEKSRYYSTVLFILLKLHSKNFIFLEENFILYHSIQKGKEFISINYYEDESSLINLIKNILHVENEKSELICIHNNNFRFNTDSKNDAVTALRKECLNLPPAIPINTLFPKLNRQIKSKRYEIFCENNKKFSLLKNLFLFLILSVSLVLCTCRFFVHYKSLQKLNNESLALKKKLNELTKREKLKTKSEKANSETNYFYEVITSLNEIEINYLIKSFVLEDSKLKLKLYSKNAYEFYSKMISVRMFSKLKLSNVSVYEDGEIFNIEGDLCLE